MQILSLLTTQLNYLRGKMVIEKELYKNEIADQKNGSLKGQLS